jgi:hypothetical protein
MRHGDAKHRRARTDETRRQPTLERAGSARARLREAPYKAPGKSAAFVRLLETRGLHALTREKPVDRFAMNAQHAADAHGVEPTVVNQTPDRLRVDAELVGDLTNADKLRLLLRR